MTLLERPLGDQPPHHEKPDAGDVPLQDFIHAAL